MIKSLSLPHIFGVHKKSEHLGGIASIKQRVRPRHSYKIGQAFWLYASYVLIAVNVVVMFSYLLGVNAQAASGYEIQKIQGKIFALTEENKQLNLKVSKQSTIAEIQTDYLNSGYVPMGAGNFLQVNNYTKR
jgi:hypothetical protein